ncbi:SUI1 family translation initiation factor [Paraburkholderia caribensis]|uniref:hypothetical protein n=1 Tax=Paraburkholderia caribensis TaxID=75105 RepID=UPI0029C9E8A8|nr:hypothetical protein [Paraburkholderia caribensis]
MYLQGGFQWVAPGDGATRVMRESDGQGEKTVTIVKGVALDPLDLASPGKHLCTACGSEGTVKDGVMEIQCRPLRLDHRSAQTRRPQS